MLDNKKQRGENLQLIDKQMARIEELVTKLLNGMNVDELGPYQRLNVIIRLFAQQSHMIELRHSCTDPESSNQSLILALMQHMRDEETLYIEMGEKGEVYEDMEG
jgi:hypothetical protein